ncbi:hypothetical protein [Chryseolinea lacunae]|uniref:Uncharacterized protein n=1 Tax=Chryseolinea lacunae TaxID=2801331 RepID=A0ABS1L2Y6_9BACT|nr:hypothetical protein [Chryseolinea lacunae]MBL0745913.1 hypothetical protein [Chryseolinea lacunae]
MKTSILILIVVGLTMGCTEDSAPQFEIGSGFEIYLTVKPYAQNETIDYSKINFDTLQLESTPMLRYNDLKRYDRLTHKLTLNISHDALALNEAGVRGRMFVVTLDKIPVYVGFKWRVISSIPPSWVYIEEPYAELDHLSDNEIVIGVPSNIADPRLDQRIVSRLKADGKIN